jgi:hypothetical protein
MRTFEADEGYFDAEDWCVWVRTGDVREPLDPHLEVMNKSPTGFAWGYGGSGPAQLAFALLAAVIGVERARNPELFQRFKFEVVAKLDPDKGWKLTEDEITNWVAAHRSAEEI